MKLALPFVALSFAMLTGCGDDRGGGKQDGGLDLSAAGGPVDLAAPSDYGRLDCQATLDDYCAENAGFCIRSFAALGLSDGGCIEQTGVINFCEQYILVDYYDDGDGGTTFVKLPITAVYSSTTQELVAMLTGENAVCLGGPTVFVGPQACVLDSSETRTLCRPSYGTP
jgi:hypothetical protein